MDKELADSGIVICTGNKSYNKCEFRTIPELNFLIASCQYDIDNLIRLNSKGKIPFSELEYHVAPYQSKIKTLLQLIEDRKQQDAINVVAQFI